MRKGSVGFLLTINGPHIDSLPDGGLARAAPPAPRKSDVDALRGRARYLDDESDAPKHEGWVPIASLLGGFDVPAAAAVVIARPIATWLTAPKSATTLAGRPSSAGPQTISWVPHDGRAEGRPHTTPALAA